MTNDTINKINREIKWTLINTDNEIIESGNLNCNADKFSSIQITTPVSWCNVNFKIKAMNSSQAI